MRKFLLLILLTGVAQAQVSVPLTPGWNGVAFQHAQVTELPPHGSLAGQATWDGTAYQTGALTPAAVNAGDGTRRGFWVFATQATTLTYTGTGQGSSLNLRSGYNLVSFASSSPITALTAQQNGQTVPLGSVVLTTFTQIDANGQYTPVNMANGGTLQPGRPYWVFANAAVTLNWTTVSPSPSPTGTPPGAFNLLGPANRDSSVNAPQLSWQPSAGATSYTVEVATTPAFGGSKVLTHTGLTGTQDQLTAAELNAGMVAYFWRVTALGPGGSRQAGPFWFSQPVSVPNPTAVTASATRAVVAGDSSPGTARILNLATGLPVANLTVDTSPRAAATSPNGLQAMVVNQGSVSVINLGGANLIGQVSLGVAGASLGDASYSPDGSQVLIADTRTNQAGVSVFNVASLAFGIRFTLNATVPTQGIALSPDGATLFAGLGGGQNARRLALSSGVVTELTGFPSIFGVRTLASPELLGAAGPGVSRYSLDTNQTFVQLPFAAANLFHNLEVSPDRTRAVGLGDSSVGVVDLATNTLSHTLPIAGANYVAVYTSPAGEATALVTVPLENQVRVLSFR